MHPCSPSNASGRMHSGAIRKECDIPMALSFRCITAWVVTAAPSFWITVSSLYHHFKVSSNFFLRFFMYDLLTAGVHHVGELPHYRILDSLLLLCGRQARVSEDLAGAEMRKWHICFSCICSVTCSGTPLFRSRSITNNIHMNLDSVFLFLLREVAFAHCRVYVLRPVPGPHDHFLAIPQHDVFTTPSIRNPLFVVKGLPLHPLN